MFDGCEPFLRGQLDIGDFHIILEIQPCLGPQRIAGPLRHHPDGGHRAFLCVHGQGGHGHILRLSGGQGGSLARRHRIGQHSGAAQMAIGHPCGDHETRAISTGRRAGRVGAKHRLRIVPDQLATAMRPQMHDRRPAARHRHAIAGDFFQHGAFTGLRTKRDTGDPLAAFDLCDAFAIRNTDAQGAGLVDQWPFRRGARIDDDRHVQPRLFQGNGGAVGIVVIGDNHGAIPDRDAEIDSIIAHSPSQHHAGQIIASE